MSVVKEFKDFLMRGNLVEIAVGLILALAFSAVVNSLVENVFTPLIAAIFGKPDFGDLVLGVGQGEIRYGLFLNEVISFVLIGFVLFVVMKAYTRAVELARRGADPAAADPEDAQVALLREIRDSLRARP